MARIQGVEAVLFADRSCTEAIAQASMAVTDEDSDVDTLDMTWLKLKVPKDPTRFAMICCFHWDRIVFYSFFKGCI